MATYQIKIRTKARKALARLPREAQERIAATIEGLAKDPFSRETDKLRGSGSARKVRVGDYRIVYDVIADQLLVHVIRIGHRKEVYKRLGG